MKRAIPIACTSLALLGLTACGSSSATVEQPSAARAFAASPAQDEGETDSPAVKRARDRAEDVLKDVDGEGNAMADVSIMGIGKQRTEDLRAALVRVTNSTEEKAFYSIRVEFINSDGETVDTTILGLPDVEPGELVERHAISRKAAGERTVPTITKAQRD